MLSAALALPTFLLAQDAWMMRDSVNGPHRSAAIGFSLPNGQGYIGTGWDGDSYKRSFFSYDPQQDDWDQEISIGGITGQGLGRSSAACFTIGVDAYVGTGQGANPFFKDFWKYDPYAKVWTQVADFGGTGRRSAIAFSINNYGYVGTGYDQYLNYKNDFWKYDPIDNAWSPVSPFPGTARDQAVAFVIDTIAYAGTGDDGTFTRDFWKYSPSTDQWNQIADFPGTPRYGAAAFSVDTAGFLCTGYDSTFHFNRDIWEYHPINDEWVERAPLPGPPRSHATAFSINGTGYIGLGYRGILMDDFWAYFPTVGVNEYKQKTKLRIFPNPANEFINVVFPDLSKLPASIKLYSATGRYIRERVISTGMAKAPIRLNTRDLPVGVYFLLTEGSSTGAARFIVQHNRQQ